MLLSQDDILLFYKSPLIVQVYLPEEQNQISHDFVLSKFPEKMLIYICIHYSVKYGITIVIN